MITKFKNGKILMSTKRDFLMGYYNESSIESFYNNECFMNGITFTYIHGEPYFIDINTRLAYDSPFSYFSDFLYHMCRKKKLRLFPHGKRVSEELCNKYLNSIDW